jgi:xylan 1,4-beta-xylosidase
MDLFFQGIPGNAKVTLQRVDSKHGNVLPRYAAMGKPLDPSPAQVEQLNRETALPAAEQTHLSDGKLKLELEPNALVLVRVDR